MSKLKQFLKKYWLWIVIGISLGIIIAVIVIIFNNKNAENELKILKIESPYGILEKEIDIELNAKEESFKNKEIVSKASRPDEEIVVNFIKTVFNKTESVDLTKDITLQYGDNYVSYVANTGVFLLFPSEDGLVMDLKINSVKDVESFFIQYFNIKEIENIKVEDIDGGIKYSGYYNYKDMQIASPYLDGYAYTVSFDNAGKLLELKMLLLQDKDVVLYQTMPTKDVTSLLAIPKYPKIYFNTTVEERFYKVLPLIRASAELINLSITKVETLHIFNDFDSELILPTYKLTGDGQLKDSQGDTFWTKTYLYICGVDPEYVLERQEEEVTFNPVPYIPE